MMMQSPIRPSRRAFDAAAWRRVEEALWAEACGIMADDCVDDGDDGFYAEQDAFGYAPSRLAPDLPAAPWRPRPPERTSLPVLPVPHGPSAPRVSP